MTLTEIKTQIDNFGKRKQEKLKNTVTSRKS